MGITFTNPNFGGNELIGVSGNGHEQGNQQSEFDSCARGKIRTFRRAEYRAIGKIAGGAIVFTVSTIAGGKALGGLLSIGSAMARSGARIVGFNAGYRYLQLGTAGTIVGGLMSGYYVGEGFSDSARNNATVDAGIDGCKKQFPQANHSTLRLFTTTF